MNTMRAVRAHRREGPEQLAQDRRFEVAEVDVVRDTAGGDTHTRPWGPLHPGGALAGTAAPPEKEHPRGKAVIHVADG
ncbi:hypothetical protein [Streptomyces sp. OK228]|uniref:hypothetical protein n=1 Tax=Streptomyces sp. OK228 TaxID=1882786 RepID=UPI000BD35AD6|nr:hypothetical protein [Streptomyces sp. OK228]SOE32706.1 hypothetical protein SAMN05442782_9689 [Streptomyces sp. OK228]